MVSGILAFVHPLATCSQPEAKMMEVDGLTETETVSFIITVNRVDSSGPSRVRKDAIFQLSSHM